MVCVFSSFSLLLLREAEATTAMAPTAMSSAKRRMKRNMRKFIIEVLEYIVSNVMMISNANKKNDSKTKAAVI
jgi:hypothetical protein